MNGEPWGGSEELWFQTALYAAKNGYRIGCALYDWPQKKERIQQLQNAGCQLYLFSNKGRERKTFWEKLQHKITKRKVRRYANRLPVPDYDLTVINLGHLEIISPYWKDFRRHVKNYALVFEQHDENDVIKPNKKELLRQWLLQARHTLFASARTRRLLEKELAITLHNAGTLINPPSFKAPEERTAYPPLRNGNFVFVMLAALDTRRKAQDHLIKALSTQKWKERLWQLELYGEGEAKQTLHELIVGEGMQEKIFLRGHTSDVKGVLREAHLLLQMTHIDAMPLAVMEALAMGRPVAVSNLGDMPEWVNENQNGWISENASVEAIDKTLEEAWQNRHRWAEMGEASFHLFREKFPAVPEAYFLEQLSR